MAAEAELKSEGVPTGERVTLLKMVPALARLPDEALEELAVLLREEHYPAGSVVLAEGDTGDRLYLIFEGRAEVSAAGQGGSVPPTASNALYMRSPPHASIAE